jgi:hypothetical protein
MVRFLAYFQIKQHVPLLVLFSVKSFNFNSCEFTNQVEYLTRKLRHSVKKYRTSNIHHLQLRLHGSLIHFDPLVFELATSILT